MADPAAKGHEGTSRANIHARIRHEKTMGICNDQRNAVLMIAKERTKGMSRKRRM